MRADMVAYWYWCAACPSCRAMQIFGYIGRDADYPNGPDGGSISGPLPDQIECATCGVTHAYGVKDIEPRMLATPVPPGDVIAAVAIERIRTDG
ncbi:MAG TPA: hypothetical protein VFM88_09820 [Vicinamibacteria bacterium]|nr:hypothetical protein [Vicinamibacteria bacterium]